MTAKPSTAVAEAVRCCQDAGLAVPKMWLEVLTVLESKLPLLRKYNIMSKSVCAGIHDEAKLSKALETTLQSLANC